MTAREDREFKANLRRIMGPAMSAVCKEIFEHNQKLKQLYMVMGSMSKDLAEQRHAINFLMRKRR